jgi:hypothetical protein
MTRKPRSDSAAAAINAAVAAASPLPECPSHVRLRDIDQPFWSDILRARAREEWTNADLVVAAQLSRCMADIEKESFSLEDEGSVLTNERGTKVMNPRHAVLEQLARREMALMRSLRIAGTATGDTRDLEKGRKLQRQAEAARDGITEDDLLAS